MSHNNQAVRRFQVRLVEAREPNVAIGRFKTSVNILLLISIVFEVVHAFTVCDILAFKEHFDLVFLACLTQ
jgi:hypothetical protein